MGADTVYKKLREMGMTLAGACGMMANIQHESGMISNRVEVLCLKRLRENGKYYTDATYTAFVNDGTITREMFLHPLPHRQYGYGLCQWTTPLRKGALYDYAQKKRTSIGDEEMQLSFLGLELRRDFPAVWKTLTTSTRVDECCDIVLTRFEMPDNADGLKKARRMTAHDFYERYMDVTIPEKALQWMEALAADQSHGYSQANRWGPDYDCSSAVISAYQYAGVPVKSGGATYTGNMKPVFLRNGFSDVTASVNLATCAGMKKGDVLLNEVHHTAMYAGDKKMVHARGQSFGSSATGDQGTEISVTGYYNYPWNCVLRYTGEETAEYSVTASLPMIERGATGIAVKVWQCIVGVTADGDFGNLTRQATIEYQQKRGLAPDGVVGPITWKSGLDSL